MRLPRGAVVVGVALCVAVGSLIFGSEHTTLVAGERGGTTEHSRAVTVDGSVRFADGDSGRSSELLSGSSGASGAVLAGAQPVRHVTVTKDRSGDAARLSTAWLPASLPSLSAATTSSSGGTAPALASNRNAATPRHFLVFIHVPKMGGTSLRKLFCGLRTDSWVCPYS